MIASLGAEGPHQGVAEILKAGAQVVGVRREVRKLVERHHCPCARTLNPRLPLTLPPLGVPLTLPPPSFVTEAAVQQTNSVLLLGLVLPLLRVVQLWDALLLPVVPGDLGAGLGGHGSHSGLPAAAVAAAATGTRDCCVCLMALALGPCGPVAQGQPGSWVWALVSAQMQREGACRCVACHGPWQGHGWVQAYDVRHT